AERRLMAEVDLELELGAGALEVLVELSPYRIDRLRRAQDAHAKCLRERLGLALRLRVVRDPAQAAVGRRDEQRPDRRLGEVVRDVEEPGGRGRFPEARVECGGDGHCILLRSLLTPDEAA